MSDAWSLARDVAKAAGVDLRPCLTIVDARQIVRVMTATWGSAQLLPVEEIRAFAVSGNVPYGAFVGPELVGYVLGWAGVDADGLHVHSHMLAAVPAWRHSGVGTALKLAQRAQALDQGIGIIRWTFDPLVARNAHFNLHKLGAVADRFDRDFYGDMGDEINRGDRTDRLTVRWDLERVPGPRPTRVHDHPIVLGTAGSAEAPHPKTGVEPTTGAAIAIPSEYHDLRGGSPALARDWREAAARAIERCLAAGLVASGFERDRSCYVFELPV
jgi:predicted GNAT superfamily acetyltransferase